MKSVKARLIVLLMMLALILSGCYVDPNNAVTAYSYTGVPEAQAVAAAQADGLTVKVEYGTSEKVAPGEVYEQSIAPNTLVNRGTEIVFHINGKAEAQAAPAT